MDFSHYGTWALIAGGSDGVGAAFAELLAEAGMNLVLVARRPEPLKATAQRLRERWGNEVITIAADLLDRDDLKHIHQATSHIEIGMLICNAGAETRFADFHDDPLERTQALVGLNILASADLIYHFGGLMRNRGRGAILMMGSIAGYVGSPKIAVYAAVKAYVLTFAEGLWEEMRHHGVDALCFVIGATNSQTMQRTVGFDNQDIAQPMDVARDGLAHLSDGPIYVTKGQQEEAIRLRTLTSREGITETTAAATMYSDFIAQKADS